MHLFTRYANLLHNDGAIEGMHKTKRQQNIMSLIRARRIGARQEVTALLERAGFVATQPSVSGDLEELGVVKHNGHYTLPRTTEGAASRGLHGLEPAGGGPG